jgi:DNA (cytosine-5)-methyltransferase 1
MRLLDLYCGEGGAAVGYARAGFTVTGVDHRRTAGRYFPFTFIADDAIEYAKQYAHEYDVIHASPPCQRHTQGLTATKSSNGDGVRAVRRAAPSQIAAIRDVLIASGKPYVIENVPRAPLYDPIVLCGTMFGLSTYDDDDTLLLLQRHRLFESNVVLFSPSECRHPAGAQWAGVYDGARHDKDAARFERRGGYVPSRAKQFELMGIDWHMTTQGLFQAIPPDYTMHVGSLLMQYVLRELSD